MLSRGRTAARAMRTAAARRAPPLKAFTGMERKIEWTAARVLLLVQRFA
jgi:hypothetical protein